MAGAVGTVRWVTVLGSENVQAGNGIMKLTCESAEACQQIASTMETTVATAATAIVIAITVCAVAYHGYVWHQRRRRQAKRSQR